MGGVAGRNHFVLGPYLNRIRTDWSLVEALAEGDEFASFAHHSAVARVETGFGPVAQLASAVGVTPGALGLGVLAEHLGCCRDGTRLAEGRDGVVERVRLRRLAVAGSFGRTEESAKPRSQVPIVQ